MKSPNEARNAEIVRRRQAGQTFVEIANAMGITYKVAQATYSREMARDAKDDKVLANPSERTLRRWRAAGKDVEIVVAQPAYNPALIRQVYGTASCREYRPPVVLRVNGEKAKAVQKPLMSCASRVADGRGA